MAGTTPISTFGSLSPTRSHTRSGRSISRFPRGDAARERRDTKDERSAHIERVSTDMRPLSLRKALDLGR